MNWEAFVVALSEAERDELARMMQRMGYPKTADAAEISMALAIADARQRELAFASMVRSGRLSTSAAGELIAKGNRLHAYEPKADVHDLR